MTEISTQNTVSSKFTIFIRKNLALFILFCLLLAIIIIFKSFFQPRPSYLPKGMQGEKAITFEIERLVNTWDVTATWLEELLVFTTYSAIIFSLFVAGYADNENFRNTVKIYAFLAALFSPSITSFNMPQKVGNYRNAQRHLNEALMSYEAGSRDSAELRKVINAYASAEQEIGILEYNYASKEGKSKNGEK